MKPKANNIIKTISLSDALEKTDYEKSVKKVIQQLILDDFPNNKMYLFRKTSKISLPILIIIIAHNLKVSLKGKFYDIPLLIYFPDSFPLGAPEIYIEKKGKYLQINKTIPNYFISQEDLRVNFQLYKKWDKSASSINKVLKFLEDIFNRFFPVFKSKVENKFSGYCNLDYKNIILIHNNFKIDINDINENETELINKTEKHTSNNDKNDNNYNNDNNDNKDNADNNDDNDKLITPQEDEDLNTPTGNILKDSIFNEEQLRTNLLGKINLNLGKKVCQAILNEYNIYQNLDLLKNKINNKITKFNNIFEKEKNLNENILNCEKELEIISNDENNNFINKFNTLNITEKSNMMIQIENPKYLQRKIKIKIIEEFITIIKKAISGKAINITDIIPTIQKVNKELFKLKYGLYKNPNQ